MKARYSIDGAAATNIWYHEGYTVSSGQISAIGRELSLIKLAREIAMDIQPIETILKQYSIDDERWEELQRNARFRALLESEVESWNSAVNTHERVKLKAAAMMEEWLPELNNRLHDLEETLPAKIEGGKMLAKIAGMGERAANEGPAGEKFTVTINLGAQAPPIEISKDVGPKVIEGEVVASD
jgi:DNA-binding transcriptional MerR regulator